MSILKGISVCRQIKSRPFFGLIGFHYAAFACGGRNTGKFMSTGEVVFKSHEALVVPVGMEMSSSGQRQCLQRHALLYKHVSVSFTPRRRLMNGVVLFTFCICTPQITFAVLCYFWRVIGVGVPQSWKPFALLRNSVCLFKIAITHHPRRHAALSPSAIRYLPLRHVTFSCNLLQTAFLQTCFTHLFTLKLYPITSMMRSLLHQFKGLIQLTPFHLDQSYNQLPDQLKGNSRMGVQLYGFKPTHT